MRASTHGRDRERAAALAVCRVCCVPCRMCPAFRAARRSPLVSLSRLTSPAFLVPRQSAYTHTLRVHRQHTHSHIHLTKSMSPRHIAGALSSPAAPSTETAPDPATACVCDMHKYHAARASGEGGGGAARAHSVAGLSLRTPVRRAERTPQRVPVISRGWRRCSAGACGHCPRARAARAPRAAR